ncbi:MAG: hypothetical protein IJO43_04130 [Bacilli bacterium]|nr:hypothetical protein [Bacilli bacterium]
MNKKKAITIVVLVVVVLSLIIGGIFIFNKPKKENNNSGDAELKEEENVNSDDIELVPLTKNTNELLTFVEEGVNQGFIGTYAFVVTYSFGSDDITKTISVLKKDGSVGNLVTFDLEDRIEGCYYKEGVFYITTFDSIYFVDIREGNGNYYLQKSDENFELDEDYKLVGGIEKRVEISDNNCIYINSDDFVCQVPSNNDSEYIMHYLSANVGDKESWNIKDENKSFYHVGILSNNQLLIEIHENGKIIGDTELAVVDLNTGKILKDQKLDIEHKGGIEIYYID